jgi:hypothetical protein
MQVQYSMHYALCTILIHYHAGTFAGGAFDGLQCCVGKDQPNGANCTGDHRGEFSLNATRDWADLGPLHPRVKKQVGNRLAQGLYATSYGGKVALAGPVFSGCSVAKDGQSMTITFNSTLLVGESVGFDAKVSRLQVQ